jgi:putative ABC transport system permease protein
MFLNCLPRNLDMELVKFILRNTMRHRLRTLLTVFGMAVAILAFCLLRTVVDAWYAGVSAASPNRLITRNATSLMFPLPLSYRDKIMHVEGVNQVAYANWFGGVYIDARHFFPRMAVGPGSFLDLFPEFVVPSDQLRSFRHRKNGCIVGRKLVKEYGWKIGEIIPITGNIYPGDWQFVIVGIYKGARKTTDETQLLFRWDYLDEVMKQTMPRRAGQVGWYIVQIKDPKNAAAISQKIDGLFKNSLAETITETEKAFQMGFVAMTEAIVVAVRIVSFVVIAVILVVLANTMVMTARERTAEYAVLKTLGFGNRFLSTLIAGESVAISLAGGVLGTAFAFPVADVFSKQIGPLLPVFEIHWQTVATGFGISLGIGLLAALFPAWRAVHVRIAEALSHLG